MFLLTFIFTFSGLTGLLLHKYVSKLWLKVLIAILASPVVAVMGAGATLAIYEVSGNYHGERPDAIFLGAAGTVIFLPFIILFDAWLIKKYARKRQTAESSPVPPPQTPSPFNEDAVYEFVAHEIDSGKTEKGLWTRLYAEMGGDETQTKVAYIKKRAEKIMASERTRFEEEQNAIQIMAAESMQLSSATGVSIEQAREMLKLGVTKDGDKFAFKEYRYDQLTDALNYAKNAHSTPLGQ